MRLRVALPIAIAIAVAGCTDRAVPRNAAETSTADATSTSSPATTFGEATGIASTADATSSDATSSTGIDATTESGGGCPFVCPSDLGDDVIACDIWAQGCPAGSKCMPWANDDGNSWNATRCSPIDPRPNGIGDPCTVEGSGVSGIDDCELGAMCWDVDETNAGVCVGLCAGSPEDPICEDANAECGIFNDGTLILCLEGCDPAVQDCGEGEACYSAEVGFFCGPDFQNQGLFGESCELVYDCDAGLFCAEPSAVLDCPSETGCCSSFCDLAAEDPTARCQVADGQVCVPWYAPGQAPPGLQHVGYCAVPP